MDNALPTHCVTCPTLQSPSLEGAALIRALNCEPVDVSATATGNPGTLQRMQCRRISPSMASQHCAVEWSAGASCWLSPSGTAASQPPWLASFSSEQLARGGGQAQATNITWDTCWTRLPYTVVMSPL